MLTPTAHRSLFLRTFAKPRWLFACVLLVLLPIISTAEPQASAPSSAPTAVPAARAAKNVAIITIHGEIDSWTARSVTRRIQDAAASGADAIVFDIDTPGGDGLAMLTITSAIKACSVPTVAWVNPKAYSAGAVISLACKEIVIADAAVLGDALPIYFNLYGGLKPLPDAEREKILGPIMAELIDSARRNGQDEMLVQAFVRRGVELWLIEHKTTGQRLFVTKEQYEQAVGHPPTRTNAQIKSITGPINKTSVPPLGERKLEAKSDDEADAEPIEPPIVRGKADKGGAVDDTTRFIPAAPNVTRALTEDVDALLALKGRRTARPNLAAPENAGQFKEVEYVTDGFGILTIHGDDLLRYHIAVANVKNDAELQKFFGASSMVRLDESWSESLARLLSNIFVKGVLIIIFLVGLFIEMAHPGVILPGAVAGVALVGLMLPPVLVSMSAWWMIAAIFVGVILIATELFVVPGVIFCGVIGVILLFGGLVGAVLGGPSALFPNTPGHRNDLAYAVATTVISIFTAIILMWFFGRHLHALPGFNRLVLKLERSDGDLAGTLAASEVVIQIGDEGVTVSALRPAGRAMIDDRLIDVVADLGFIDSGVRVRVVSADAFRVVVEAVKGDKA